MKIQNIVFERKKKCYKYIQTLIMNCIGEKLGKNELKKSKIQFKIWALILWLSIYLFIYQIVNYFFN